MKRDGYTWTDEYRAHFYSSERVQAHLEKFVAQASRPKSETQRQKMSLAKTGRKYSEEHKHNMSEAQKFRLSLKKQFQELHPEATQDQIRELVRARIHAV
jgi:hypothetical protein